MIRYAYLFVLLVCLSGPMYGQDVPVVKNEVIKNSKGVVTKKYTTIDGKIDGAYHAFYDSGAKYIVGNYSMDKRHGSWLEFHENGKKSSEGNYAAGYLTGAAAKYHPDGKLHIKCNFEKGYAKGNWVEHHSNGQLYGSGEVSSSRINHFEAPVRQGIWEFFYDTGVASWKGAYKNNNWSGSTTGYHTNGKKHYECEYQGGYAKGTWSEYHNNGRLYGSGNVSTSRANHFEQRIMQGEWSYFYNDGVKSWSGEYTNSNWDGAITRYYTNGNKQYECEYKAGYATGTWSQYHENAQLQSSGEVSRSRMSHFESPVRQGDWTWFHNNGNKEWTGSYVDSNWEGLVVSYYNSGEIHQQCAYKSGYAQGAYKAFHENGQVGSEGEVSNSRINRFENFVHEGSWVHHHDNGEKSFEGSYIRGKLDGSATWFFGNGQQSFNSDWIDGTMKGSWTSWHSNGNKSSHGHCYGGNHNNPLKAGPWVWYHDNGEKSAEGSYRRNIPVGPWVYYDENGRVKDVKNFINGKSKAISTAELENGKKIIRTSNPDGSSDTYYIDKDGKLTEHKKKLPPEKQEPFIEYEDPETGEKTTITHDKDGHSKITKSKSEVDDDGTKRTHESDDDGTEREITERPNGEREYKESRPDGRVRESKRDKDGRLTRKQTNPDGTTVEYTKETDGRKTRTKRDAQGNIIEEAERNPAGVETTKKPDGTTTRRHKNDDGNWVETTERKDGTISKVVRDTKGNVISRDDKWGKRDAGQSLYEDVQGGRGWKELSDEDKSRYADTEGKLKDKGQFENIRNNAADAESTERDEARAKTDEALSTVDSDLKKKPISLKAKRRKQAENRDNFGKAAKALELALRMPDIPFEQIQSDLEKALGDKDKDKLAELLDQDRNSLPGWLNKNPDVAKKWTQAAKSGGSAIASALAVSKGVDHLFKGEYGAALEEFAGGLGSAFGAIPPATMAKIEKELGRNPAQQALALKNLISFGREASRKLKKGESRNYGKLFKEGVGFIVNGYKSMPEAQRKHFMERNMSGMSKWLKKLDQGVGKSSVKRSAALMALVDSAPAVYKLVNEWGGRNDAANITNLAKTVGPKAIGMLVQASTRSETAGQAAEFVAQLGADYMAHLGNEARIAARAALSQTENNSRAYTRMRDAIRAQAVKAGMTHRDAEQYETVANLVSGHRGKLVLSDMRHNKNLLGMREAMQAWRRVNKDLKSGSGGVGYFYEGLTDTKSREEGDESAYQRWKINQVNTARRTATHIGGILSEYSTDSAAYKYLSAWKHDLDGMVRTFG